MERGPPGAVREKDGWGQGEARGQEAACPHLFVFLQEDGGCQKTQGQECVWGEISSEYGGDVTTFVNWGK